jgi:nucleoside-diphosphate-sugar epimerase
MRNLVIGNTSQLSYYFPDDYVKISSRNIDYDFIRSENWNRVFLCFGESRKFLSDIKIYDDINFYYTLEVINNIKDVSRNIIVYSTCELWNQIDGKIDISMNFNFFSTPYLQSKYRISKYLLNNKSEYYNVFIIYPFNFNSIYRSDDFLFGKIFNSIINKKKIEIGYTYFYRDIVHPKFVVDKSISARGHEIIGSGRLTFVNDFIRDLYQHYQMDYDEYVIENFDKYNEYDKRKEYYLNSKKPLYTYMQLLKDTISDIDKKNNKNH